MVKYKAQRIKHKDVIPDGDNFRSDFFIYVLKKGSNSIPFLMPSLFFILYALDFETNQPNKAPSPSLSAYPERKPILAYCGTHVRLQKC